MNKQILMMVVLLLNMLAAEAQVTIRGKVIDKDTHEPVAGASITIPNTNIATVTDHTGAFSVQAAQKPACVCVTCIGYQLQNCSMHHEADMMTILLEKNAQVMNELIVTASRGVQLRKDAPVSIQPITSKTIYETKPVLLPELINKVPGVLMTNLNNEQHSMSIRQPMTTSPYFLYLEDGIPVRPAGIFNHNALIETDIMAVSSIEVVKGPSSSLYGSEAIGGAINFITHRPTADFTAKVGAQWDNYGYMRAQFAAGGYYTKKAGVYVSGFVARQRDGWQTYSDYDKTALNLRNDVQLSKNTQLIISGSYIKYNTQTAGSVDSLQYFQRKYVSNNSFTFRDVYALRARATLDHKWNDNSSFTATVFYRDNSIGQFPAYAIKKDNANPAKAHGQINENSLNSYGMVFQQTQKFDWLKAKLVAGITIDYSPNKYWANYALINRDPATGFMASYENRPDSMLTDYNAKLLNTAAYAQFQFSPVEKLNVVIGARYDRIDFSYDNHLPPSAYSGAPDEKNGFNNFSPKVGATYEISRHAGVYVNYSRGFSPPTINQLYSGVKVPVLKPAYFNNYETGGWLVLLDNKLSFDWAIYQMDGFNEVVSFRFPDNSTENRNSGRTLHRGVEYGITYRPDKQWTIRAGGTNATHEYVEYEVKEGINYDGNKMPSAPSFIANAEIGYRPAWLKGFRINAEWQRISSYFIDNENKYQYNDKTLFGLRGVSVLNLRAGYQYRWVEVFANLMNVTNELYAHNASRGAFGTTYTPAAPRLLNMGLQFHL
jgi:outer membrane receptor protein involved in Fe transport